MKCNVGGVDRTLRIVGGVMLGILALFLPVELGWRIVLGVLAVIALVTATVRFCPLNALLGLNTCSDARPDAEAGIR